MNQSELSEDQLMFCIVLRDASYLSAIKVMNKLLCKADPTAREDLWRDAINETNDAFAKMSELEIGAIAKQNVEELLGLQLGLDLDRKSFWEGAAERLRKQPGMEGFNIEITEL